MHVDLGHHREGGVLLGNPPTPESYRHFTGYIPHMKGESAELMEAGGNLQKLVFADCLSQGYDPVRNLHYLSVIMDGSLCVATGGLNLDPESPQGVISGLATHADYRGIGLGSVILGGLETTAWAMYMDLVRLTAVSENVQFYIERGYEVYGGDETKSYMLKRPPQ